MKVCAPEGMRTSGVKAMDPSPLPLADEANSPHPQPSHDPRPARPSKWVFVMQTCEAFHFIIIIFLINFLFLKHLILFYFIFLCVNLVEFK